MSFASTGMSLIAAPARPVAGIHVSTSVLVIIAIVAVIGGYFILGWRAPDRSPHGEERAEREREE